MPVELPDVDDAFSSLFHFFLPASLFGLSTLRNGSIRFTMLMHTANGLIAFCLTTCPNVIVKTLVTVLTPE